MLTRVEVQSAQGALLDLPLEDLVTGFLLDEVEGLDPVKATITTSSFANLDGSQYQSSRREDRNIVLTILLEPDWSANQSVSDLRRSLYDYFMPKSPVNLTFYSTSGNPVKIAGRVESFETPLFSADPAVKISIICFDPDFYEEVPLTIAGNTTATTTYVPHDYTGTAETGVLFTLNVNRTLGSFSIDVATALGQQTLSFTGSLLAGDVVKINTTPGVKSVRLTRAGAESSFLWGVSPESDWVSLKPGSNDIRVFATGAAIPFTMDYIRKYGGL